MKIIFVSYASKEKALQGQQQVIESQRDYFEKQGIELSLIQPKTGKIPSRILSNCVLIHPKNMAELLRDYEAWSSPTPAIFFNSFDDGQIFVVNGTQKETFRVSKYEMRLLREYYDKALSEAGGDGFVHLNCGEEDWFKGIYQKISNILVDPEEYFFDPTAPETSELHLVLEALSHNDGQTVGIALEPPDEVTSFYDQNEDLAEIKPAALIGRQLTQVEGIERRHALTPATIHQVIPPEQTLNLTTLNAVKNLDASTLVFFVGHERKGIPKHIFNLPSVLAMSLFGQPANIATYQAFLTTLSLLKMSTSTEKDSTSPPASGEPSRVNYTFNSIDDLLGSLPELVDKSGEHTMDFHTSNPTLLERQVQEYLIDTSLIAKNKVAVFRTERFLNTPASFDLFICTKNALHEHKAEVDTIIKRKGCIVVLDKASRTFQLYPMEGIQITKQLSNFIYKTLLAGYQTEIKHGSGEKNPLVNIQSSLVKNLVARVCNKVNYPLLDTPITLTVHKPCRNVNFYFVDSSMYCSPEQINQHAEKSKNNNVVVEYNSENRICHLTIGNGRGKRELDLLSNCTLEEAQQLIQRGSEGFLYLDDHNAQHLRFLNLCSQFTGSTNILTQDFLGIENENPEYRLAYDSQQHHNTYSGNLNFSPLNWTFFSPELPLMIFMSSPNEENRTSTRDDVDLPTSAIHYDNANVLFLPKPPGMDYEVYQKNIKAFLKAKVLYGHIYEEQTQIIPMTPDMAGIEGGDVTDALVRMETNPGILQGYSLTQFFSSHENAVENTDSSITERCTTQTDLSPILTVSDENVDEAPVATSMVQDVNEHPIPSITTPCISQTGLSLFPKAPEENVQDVPVPKAEDQGMNGRYTAG